MDEVNLIDLLKVLLKRIWLIILSGIVCGAIMFTYTGFFVKPSYVANATILVKSNSENQQNTASAIWTDINVAQRLAGTYRIVLTSNAAMNRLIEGYGINYSAKQLQSMISVEPVEESEVMRIKVICGNPQDAMKIANSLLEIAPSLLTDIVEVGSANIVDTADTAAKVPSNLALKTIMGFLTGALLAAVVVFFLDQADHTIRDEDDITLRYNLPVLGAVPDFSTGSKGGRK